MKQNINEIKRMQRIAGLITESEYRESLTNEDLEKVSGMKSENRIDKAKVLKALFSNDERRVTRNQLDKILRQLDFQSAKEFENTWKNAGLELDIAKPGEGYTVWEDNYAGQGDYIEFVNGKFNKVIRSGEE